MLRHLYWAQKRQSGNQTGFNSTKRHPSSLLPYTHDADGSTFMTLRSNRESCAMKTLRKISAFGLHTKYLDLAINTGCVPL